MVEDEGRAFPQSALQLDVAKGNSLQQRLLLQALARSTINARHSACTSEDLVAPTRALLLQG